MSDAGGGDVDDEVREGDLDELVLLLPLPPMFNAALSLFSTAKITCLPPCTLAGCSSTAAPLASDPDALENVDEMVEPEWLGDPGAGGAGSAIELVPFVLRGTRPAASK
uniref:Uncharacterized protein n=1 Tax=Anopheles dirus TaxID=7168 RepID=A0A182NTD2_9DIPT